MQRPKKLKEVFLCRAKSVVIFHPNVITRISKTIIHISCIQDQDFIELYLCKTSIIPIIK